MIKSTIVILTTLMLLAAFTAGTVSAQESGKKDGWRFFVDLYGWMPNIYADSATDSESEIDLDKILDDLQFMVMAAAGVNKNKWGFYLDLIYLDLKEDHSSTKNLPHLPWRPGRSINIKTEVELTSWIVQPKVSYNLVEQDKLTLSIVGGARYLYLEADLKVDIDGRRHHELSASDSGSVWDAIIGIGGEVRLNQKWFMPYYFDVGTGDSDLTYHLFGGFGYRFSRVDLMAGWRYLRWNFDDNPVLDDLYISGPIVGLKIRF